MTKNTPSQKSYANLNWAVSVDFQGNDFAEKKFVIETKFIWFNSMMKKMPQ